MTAPAIQPIPLAMTTEDTAQILRCPVATVERYVHSRDLAAVQMGRERRIRGDDLLDFIATRRPTCGKWGLTGGA